MDRAFCVSLNKEITALDAEKHYRQGVITKKNDFACPDVKCRAEYIFVNIDNKKPKVPPYFRTAKKTSKPHISGCKHDTEEKKVFVICSATPRQPRGALSENSNYIFNTNRPDRFFTRHIETSISFLHLDHTTIIRTTNSTSDEHPAIKATNINIYSIENLLKKNLKKDQEIVINGRTVSLGSFLKVVDNNLPEKKDGLIYCGLGQVIGSIGESLKIKFCRGFNIGGEIYNLTAIIDNSIFSTKSFYYKQVLEQTNAELAKIYKSNNRTAFIYVYGIPKKIKGTRNYIINVTSLDMCLIESACSNKHLFPLYIYDLEKSKHLFSQTKLS
ncbi:hypothetical protein ACIP1G_25340 [Pseudomonas sp. NPDC089392]|uniref:hypothetical protein n=1 Tax=Pseudomonas sp. NPDC089392 TaxID=3364459 RepID=UPI00382276F3